MGQRLEDSSLREAHSRQQCHKDADLLPIKKTQTRGEVPPHTSQNSRFRRRTQKMAGPVEDMESSLLLLLMMIWTPWKQDRGTPKLKSSLPHCPAAPLPGIYSRELKSLSQTGRSCTLISWQPWSHSPNYRTICVSPERWMVEKNASLCTIKSISGCDNVEGTVLSKTHPVVYGKSYRFHLSDVTKIAQDKGPIKYTSELLGNMGSGNVGAQSTDRKFGLCKTLKLWSTALRPQNSLRRIKILTMAWYYQIFK